ncbi:hypothetical protein QR680_013209 [Steinernema hermaphroditum]|uniref:Uncharacterized protein n=1 Tax=Steinernema hermaphroditum TaxID=289476 RepID=A0AA39M1W9_9BILA|nr:hypothetical protein QR680_013209 [Steinernema hermaphroditum]
MLRRNGILFRKVTAADSEALKKFMLEHLPKASPICQALQFEAEDYEAMYFPRISESLPLNLESLRPRHRRVFGGARRLPSRQLLPPRSLQESADPKEGDQEGADSRGSLGVAEGQILGDVSSGDQLGHPRRELLCEEGLPEAGNRGDFRGVDVPRGGRTGKKSFPYKEAFDAHGIAFEGAFGDGTSKAILQFRSNSEDVCQKLLRSKL